MKKYPQSFLFLIVIMAGFLGCNKSEEPMTADLDVQNAEKGCYECHSDVEFLKKVAAPDTAHVVSEGGCGGELPAMEAWEKVYVGGSGGAKFLSTVHGKIACTGCHGGVEKATKAKAHTGDFTAMPSLEAVERCATCHDRIVAKYQKSLHFTGAGQKHMVSVRSTLGSYEQWPELLKKGYDNNCGKCHATCGQCHIQRPKQAGGGFLNGHEFKKSPDMRLNCTACHAARVAHAYIPETVGLQSDVHYLKLPGGQCTNCHTSDEIHGDGLSHTNRYQTDNMPKCIDCHSSKSNSNAFHTTHWNNMTCNVCHSQDYNNCGSCHVDDGAAKGPYTGFKIGLNPIKEQRPYKFVTLRLTPGHPNTFSNYGVAVFQNFDSNPTYKYSSPHNILRKTKRTQVDAGKACYDNCHIINGKNKEIYLFDSNLEAWEKNANKNVVVDGKLPAGWVLGN